MRMQTGQETRTIADKINDPNRVSWEQFRKVKHKTDCVLDILLNDLKCASREFDQFKGRYSPLQAAWYPGRAFLQRFYSLNLYTLVFAFFFLRGVALSFLFDYFYCLWLLCPHRLGGQAVVARVNPSPINSKAPSLAQGFLLSPRLWPCAPTTSP